ncbi:MAG: amino acid adenylation domain-containing protein [Xenococcus sp. MO_188.B8]|nr:amino acid adenylation domain-containing protein [Xenococcus sp. MO_188.B8]
MLHKDDLITNQFELEKLNYWQQQLAQMPPVLSIPTDKPRLVNSGNRLNAKDQNDNYSRLTHSLCNSFKVSQDLSLALKKVAQQAAVDLEVVLLAAFQILLYRYSQQECIIVGLRKHHLNSGIINLPITIKIDPNNSFYDLLAVTNSQILQASQYSNVDLEGLKLDSATETYSLSQILFQFSSEPEPLPSTLETESKSSDRELFLNIVSEQSSESINCRLIYDSQLFDSETIERISLNYQVLLSSIVNAPTQSLKNLAILTEREKQQVLVQWNQTQARQETRTIHQLFEIRAAQNPEAIAIICHGEQLTYSELNARSNQVAHYLQSLGVGQESFVGIYLERSPAMVVGLLGILKAGAAYVPLDLGNPQPRQAFIFKDAGVSTLLTQASLLDKIPGQIETSICLDRDWDVIAQYPQYNCPCQVASSDLALIVYTSGSTGKPKGVMISHGNLGHYTRSMQIALDVTSEDVYLHRGQIDLIASARQLLMPLTQGAAAVILTESEKRDPFLMFDLIKRYGVTIVDRVPSFWRSFSDIFLRLDDETRQSIQDNRVRLVATSGEQVTPEVYQCWRETFAPHVQLANLYGQTECTGIVTVYRLPEELDHNFKSLSVGRPITNIQVYLLDEDLQPVPIGVAAEIHISGAGVAQGYLNKPELTAEKFIPNPYSPGEKLYKTGDLGRRLPDGTIQFLGRLDRQVNIQGLRIELGEIEAVLSQHQLVRETSVIVQHHKLGERLIAYVVPELNSSPTAEELKDFLSQKLPPYMLPSAVVFLESFPLTASGKIDRRALEALKLEQTTSKSQFIAPRDSVEQKLVAMLENILGVNSIGIKDNFLELGGNSLLAARLVTEIETTLSVKIPVSSIFQAPTVEALANLLRQDEAITYPQSFVPIQFGKVEPPLFCLHLLGSSLEYYLPLAKHLGNRSFYGLSSEMSGDDDAPHPRDIEALASYYLRDIEILQPEPPYLLLGVSFGGVIAYEVAQKLIAKGKKVSFLGLLDTHCPDGNKVFKSMLPQERLRHLLGNLNNKGGSYIKERLQFRIQSFQDSLRYNLHKNNLFGSRFLLDQTQTKEQIRNRDTIKYLYNREEHEQINLGYSMQVYPERLTLFRAKEDFSSKLDWKKFAGSGIDIFDVPGDHLGMLQEPNVEILAEYLKLALLNSDKFKSRDL